MNKSDQAYKTIGEVTKILNLQNKSGQKIPTHTIRFWEKEFKQIKPKLLNGKRRYYDKKNVDLLKKIKLLNTNTSNNLDEISNKSIRTDNLRNKISNISKIIEDIKKLK